MVQFCLSPPVQFCLSPDTLSVTAPPCRESRLAIGMVVTRLFWAGRGRRQRLGKRTGSSRQEIGQRLGFHTQAKGQLDLLGELCVPGLPDGGAVRRRQFAVDLHRKARRQSSARSRSSGRNAFPISRPSPAISGSDPRPTLGRPWPGAQPAVKPAATTRQCLTMARGTAPGSRSAPRTQPLRQLLISDHESDLTTRAHEETIENSAAG